ncbi:hypothetical protein D9611_012303 [Ephemerocybe angulata]|uniref:Uncharacterized protein n=1 Tax=Ephemerocybe angulata TaxID=980116 RepID=A0A8H5ESJ6_9AGAR|nr:hypothetical protein D9611_012303 [Tulosesus angulatus]
MLDNDLCTSPLSLATLGFRGHDASPMHADLSRPDHHSARIIALTSPTHPVSVMTESTHLFTSNIFVPSESLTLVTNKSFS